MIVAGIGSRKGVSCDEVLAAIRHALAEHGVSRADLSALATTAFKKDEAGIFAAGRALGLPVIVVDPVALAAVPASPHSKQAHSPQAFSQEPHGTPTLDPSPQWGGRAAARPSLETPDAVQRREAAESPSPLWGGARGGGDEGTARTDGRETALLTHSALSLEFAGTPSVSEAAALAAAGAGARLAGPRIAVGPVTCAIAFSERQP